MIADVGEETKEKGEGDEVSLPSFFLSAGLFSSFSASNGSRDSPFRSESSEADDIEESEDEGVDSVEEGRDEEGQESEVRDVEIDVEEKQRSPRITRPEMMKLQEEIHQLRRESMSLLIIVALSDSTDRMLRSFVDFSLFGTFKKLQKFALCNISWQGISLYLPFRPFSTVLPPLTFGSEGRLKIEKQMKSASLAYETDIEVHGSYFSLPLLPFLLPFLFSLFISLLQITCRIPRKLKKPRTPFLLPFPSFPLLAGSLGLTQFYRFLPFFIDRSYTHVDLGPPRPLFLPLTFASLLFSDRIHIRTHPLVKYDRFMSTSLSLIASLITRHDPLPISSVFGVRRENLHFCFNCNSPDHILSQCTEMPDRVPLLSLPLSLSSCAPNRCFFSRLRSLISHFSR